MTVHRARPLLPLPLVERAYQRIRNVLVAAIERSIPALVAAERKAAEANGIDPLYLNWFIVNGRRWPPLTQRQRDVLRAVQSIYLWFGAVPPSWEERSEPDLAEYPLRDAALREFVKIVEEKLLPALNRILTKLVWAESRKILVALKKEGMPEPRNCSLVLLAHVKRHLAADRFQQHPPTQQVLDLMTG